MKKTFLAMLCALVLGVMNPVDALALHDGAQDSPTFPDDGSDPSTSNVFRGVRFSLAEDRVHRVDGVNLSLWEAGDHHFGNVRGMSLGVTRVSASSVDGVAIAPMRVEAQVFRGVAVGGLSLAGGPLTGVLIGGLAAGSEALTGLAVGGLGVGADAIHGIAVGGLALAGSDAYGLCIGGAAMVCRQLHGFGAGAYCQVLYDQTGVIVGLLNVSQRLHGVQFGLLNYAGNNPRLLRILPFVNAHLGR